MLDFEQVRARLQDRNLKAVERGTGLAYTTLLKIKHGTANNVRHSTVKALSDYLERMP
jgi:DNA-binding Xre family transcriptional regulator